jgi:hypothetical protein
MIRELLVSTVALLVCQVSRATELTAAEIRQNKIQTPGLRVAQRALAACANAVVARILPGQDPNLLMAIDIDKRLAAEAGTHDELIIEIVAGTRQSRDALATANCTVTRNARVVNLSVRVNNRATLARLNSSDLQLSLARR